MTKISNVGAPLSDEESLSIDAALDVLKKYVAAIDPAMQPNDLTKVIFKTNDLAYAVKWAIDAAFKAANTRMWRGNVRPFNRGVSPLSGRLPEDQAAALKAAGITTKEELNAALVELGLMPKP